MRQTKHVFLLAVVAMFVGACDPDEKNDERSDEQNEQKDDEKSEQSNGTVRMRIGKHDYLTYVYGGKRWMVENSKEGTPSGIAYGSDKDGNQYAGGGGVYDNLENGYYYIWDDAASACPDGWRLPTTPEAEDLISRVSADVNGVGKWWFGDEGYRNGAFAGYLMRPYRDTIEWDDWGEFGYWWLGNRTPSVIAGEGRGVSIWGIGGIATSYWCSVRCIQK
jgi:uncharacterized protein (TIGR02145 family)